MGIATFTLVKGHLGSLVYPDDENEICKYSANTRTTTIAVIFCQICSNFYKIAIISLSKVRCIFDKNCVAVEAFFPKLGNIER